jgi:hypothetical protein
MCVFHASSLRAVGIICPTGDCDRIECLGHSIRLRADGRAEAMGERGAMYFPQFVEARDEDILQLEGVA